MSGKPSSQTEKAIEWLLTDACDAHPDRALSKAVKKFKVSRLSILVQLGQEYLKNRNSSLR